MLNMPKSAAANAATASTSDCKGLQYTDRHFSSHDIDPISAGASLNESPRGTGIFRHFSDDPFSVVILNFLKDVTVQQVHLYRPFTLSFLV